MDAYPPSRAEKAALPAEYKEPPMNIRPMTAADTDAVQQMMQVFYTSPAVLSNGSPRIFAADIAACCDPACPFLEGFILEEEGCTAGYAMLAHSFSTESGKPCIWVEDLYLKPEHRDSGMGSAFFAWLQDRYTGCIFRLEVEEENTRAFHVYQKSGFAVIPYTEMIKE